MLKKLVIVAAFAGLIANTAQAGLGWTFAEAKAHYGNPQLEIGDPKSDQYGLFEHNFEVGRYRIEAEFEPGNDGKMISVSYQTADPIDDDTFQKILKQNIDAVWTKEQEKEGKIWWSAHGPGGAYLGWAVYSTGSIFGRSIYSLQVSLASFENYLDKRNDTNNL
jgi:hypothetical protein